MPQNVLGILIKLLVKRKSHMLWNALKQHLANEGHQKLRQTLNEEPKQRVKPVARESDNGNDFLKYTE